MSIEAQTARLRAEHEAMRASFAALNGQEISVAVEEAQGVRSLAKCMSQSEDRCRDMQRLGDAVVSVEHEKTITADGKVLMIPMAVLKDGRRVNRAELRRHLGLKGAV